MIIGYEKVSRPISLLSSGNVWAHTVTYLTLVFMMSLKLLVENCAGRDQEREPGRDCL